MINDFNFKTFLSTVTSRPGVYRMYDITGTVIYVGKAKNLKKRLSNYLNIKVNSEKTKALVSNIYNIDVTVTNTETEALLLEHNYIRLYQPRYNVLLRDDKSYPYIFLSQDPYPRLTMHHFNKNNKGECFGPYPSRDAVRKTLKLIQKTFALRQCENSVYYNRSRPCILYQIGRCLGPCITGLVSEKEYSQQVNYVKLFLSGKDDQIIFQLVNRMEKASKKLYFEEAARIRNQIQAVRQVTEKQFIDTNINNLDVIGVAYNFGIACVHVLFIRQGKVLGSRSYFPIVPIETNFDEVVQTFVGQYYLQGSKARTLPTNILLGFKLSEHNLLATLLKTITGRKVKMHYNPRGKWTNYLELANTNAATALATKLSQHITIEQRLNSLASFLKVDNLNRIECFDVSHTMGEQTIASCVVFNRSGSLRSEYRRYNINNITPSNDYAAISQVLVRHYKKLLKKDTIPDVILIDGGKGQLRQAEQVIDTLEIFLNKKKPILLSIAKSNKKKLGVETIFLKSKGEGVLLPSYSPVLHIIQYIRDAAHNYAIDGHRNKQLKVKNASILENIKGIGPKRRHQLLKYMGGLQLLMNANIDDIAKVPGISIILAKKIYHSLKLKH